MEIIATDVQLFMTNRENLVGDQESHYTSMRNHDREAQNQGIRIGGKEDDVPVTSNKEEPSIQKKKKEQSRLGLGLGLVLIVMNKAQQPSAHDDSPIKNWVKTHAPKVINGCVSCVMNNQKLNFFWNNAIFKREI